MQLDARHISQFSKVACEYKVLCEGLVPGMPSAPPVPRPNARPGLAGQCEPVSDWGWASTCFAIPHSMLGGPVQDLCVPDAQHLFCTDALWGCWCLASTKCAPWSCRPACAFPNQKLSERQWPVRRQGLGSFWTTLVSHHQSVGVEAAYVNLCSLWPVRRQREAHDESWTTPVSRHQSVGAEAAMVRSWRLQHGLKQQQPAGEQAKQQG